MGLDHLGLVVDGDVELAKAVLEEAFHDGLQERLVAHRQQGLGRMFGQRAEPRPETAGHDHDPAIAFLVRAHQVVDIGEAGHPVVVVEERKLPYVLGRHAAEQQVLRIRVPRHTELLVHDVSDRRVHARSAQNGAPDVTVGNRSEQTIVRIDHQRDLHGAAIDGLDRLVDGGRRRHERVGPILHVGAPSSWGTSPPAAWTNRCPCNSTKAPGAPG